MTPRFGRIHTRLANTWPRRKNADPYIGTHRIRQGLHEEAELMYRVDYGGDHTKCRRCFTVWDGNADRAILIPCTDYPECSIPGTSDYSSLSSRHG